MTNKEVDEKALASVDEILEKYDRESIYRRSLGNWKWIVSFLAIALTLFHLYTARFGAYPSKIQGGIHLGTALGLIFLLFPIKKGWHRVQKTIPWYDALLAFLALGVGYYNVIFYNELLRRVVFGHTLLDLIVATLGVLLVLEATRRCVGLPIVIVALVFIGYGLWGNMLPFFSHKGFSWTSLTSDLFFKTEGIFGIPIQISSTFIFLFLFFGVMLVKTGIGQFFNELAFATTGRFTGGQPKAAVVASALQGMVTGSSVANTVGSGSFTIPMMKKAGYKPEFAAAVEASASTGGQIMPPVMGAAAFIMIEYTGYGYNQIMLAAIIPAVLYFTGIFLAAHFEAKKLGMKGMPKNQLPSLKNLLLTRGYLLLPLIIIIYTLLAGRTPMRAALWGIAVAFLVSFIRKETRMSRKSIINALEEGGRVALPVIAACACAGIIVGVVVQTGLGGKIAGGIISLAGGMPILVLFYTMIACLLLGMGLPTTANYVVTASMAAPALIQLDFPILAVHFFVFYFGIIADITPPVCLAAYAGAGIARANPFMTGVTAFKLGTAAYIIPYIFIFNPMLVLVDYQPLTLTIAVFAAFLGMIGVSSAMAGFFIRKSYFWERIMLFIGGVCLISPEFISDLVGLALIALIWIIQSRRPHDSSQTPLSEKESITLT